MKLKILSVLLLIVVIMSQYPDASASIGELDISEPITETSPVNDVITENSNVTTVKGDVLDNSNSEMRGTWIATVKNTNMPAGMNEEAFRKWAEDGLELLRVNGFNTVVFQARPTGDALYKSTLAPWSSFITGGSQGKDPGYDPLAIMIDTAHKKGIELHAWINPYRITMPSDKIENLSPENFAKKHPQWVVKYGSQYYLNPGVPEVKAHLSAVVTEIVSNYDVDAIHIDDYFYPYPISGQVYNDANTYKQYGAGFANIADWRRDNVTTLIREIYSQIKSVKSHVQFGVSPFGVWRNIKSDPTGSNTTAGVECYDNLYADTRQWIKEGIIDYITPQIYWSTAFKAANYNTLVQWWQHEIETYAVNKPVNLYIGIANYKVNDNSDIKWKDQNEIQNQININRLNPAVSGQMHYSFNSVKENALNHITNIKNNEYKNIALAPAPITSATAMTNSLPISMLDVIPINSVENIKLQIKSDDTNIRKFVVYRFEGATEFTDKNIISVTYKQSDNIIITDTTAESDKIYTYAIKSISKDGLLSDEYKSVMLQKY